MKKKKIDGSEVCRKNGLQSDVSYHSNLNAFHSAQAK